MKLLLLIKKYRLQFIKYVFAGFCCALINWAFFYVLNSLLLVYYLLAAFFAFMLSTTVNYFLSKVIFTSRGRTKGAEYMFILLASAIALSIDLSVMYALVEFAGIPAMFSKILGTGSAFFFNYLSRQFFIFSPQNNKENIDDKQQV
jgi:putative flippase GtrA